MECSSNTHTKIKLTIPHTGSNDYTFTLFAKIFKPKLINENTNKKPINIFMLGLDSVSRQSTFEKLPKSSNYLKKKLKSNILNGYNIVGDGTPAALIPILTSYHEHELPNTIKETSNSNFVDEVIILLKNY